MNIIKILPIIISLIALVVSCFSFRYNKNRGKVEKAIDLAKTYKDLIKDISEFTRVFEAHKNIHELIFKAKIDENTNFTYDDLSNYYTPTELSELDNFFNKQGINADILRSVYLNTKVDGSDINPLFFPSSKENLDAIYTFNPNINESSYKNEADKIKVAKTIADIHLINYYHVRFVEFLNALEYFSMAFVQNVADDDVVYQSLHQTFLGMVKYFYFLIVFRNRSSENKYYTNITDLYIKWLKKEQKQKNKINKISRYKKKC